MKVLHLIDHMGLGGAQSALLDLLEVRGPEVDAALWTLRDHTIAAAGQRLRAAGVLHFSLGLSRYDALAAVKVRRLLKQTVPDVLHTHLEFSNLLGTAAAASLGRSRPLVVNQIDNDLLRGYSPFHRLAARLLASRVDTHLLVAPSLQASARQVLADAPVRVETVTLGIDLGRFARTQEARRVAELRGGARRVVGTVGRLATQKAVHVLLEATPLLLEVEPSLRVLIVGDGPLRTSLEEQVQRLGVAHAVCLLGYQDAVEVAYQAMDTFVLCSGWEGLGLVLIEAMASDVPVIATRTTGIVDLVRDGESGLLVPFGDPRCLADTIIRLWQDECLATRLRAAARMLVQAEHSRETMAARTERLYADLWSRRPRR